MPCWVAPVVAAELWGVSLSHVLGAIADGHLPTRREYGFVLIDVAPDGTPPANPPRTGPPPPTFVAVAGEAPASWEPAPIADEPVSVPDLVPVPPVVDDSVSEELPPLDEEEDDKPISNWRQVRANMGRMRKPPGRTPPAAFAA